MSLGETSKVIRIEFGVRMRTPLQEEMRIRMEEADWHQRVISAYERSDWTALDDLNDQFEFVGAVVV